MEALATKYRPKTFEDVTEQESIKVILQQQLETGTIKNAYLFCGGAGTGKTTCARIFANEINKGKGNPIEMDAASNSGVDDVRNITHQAKLKSLDSDYKIFIIDECVTGDTEILTENGFKRIDTLTDEKVAQYTQDGKIEFVTPLEYIKRPYQGDMYKVSFRNGKKSVLMSPHHVQPLRMKGSGKIVERYISDPNLKFAQTNEVIVAGKGTGNNEMLTSFERLCVAAQADGYRSPNPRQDGMYMWQFHLALDFKKVRLLELLDDEHIEYTVHGDLEGTCNIRFYLPNTVTKKLPEMFDLNMGVDRALDFIDEILHWDGSIKSGYPGYYSCIDKDNVDFVAAVLTLAGCSGNQGVVHYDNPNHNDLYTLNWYYTDARPGQSCTKEIVPDFDGMIHCVKVPSQMIILRAEGFTFVSGNCHAISNTGWQAFLKLIEEPPKNTIFIFCTTDPQKIPKTILSRVQRYDFRRISQEGIIDRLRYICDRELTKKDDLVRLDALEYLAKLADGGMRDSITLLDKCISYSRELTLGNVVKALGTVDYESMKQLTDSIIAGHPLKAVEVVEELYNSGKDIKQFINMYTQFLLDIQKYKLTEDFRYTQLPGTDDNTEWLKTLDKNDYELCFDLLSSMVKLNSAVKWSQTPKYDLEAEILLFAMEDQE